MTDDRIQLLALSKCVFITDFMTANVDNINAILMRGSAYPTLGAILETKQSTQHQL